MSLSSFVVYLQDKVPQELQDAAQEAPEVAASMPDQAHGFFFAGAAIIVIALTIAVGAGLLLLSIALLPNLSARACHKFRSRQLFSVLVGLGAVVLGFLFAAAGSAVPIISVICGALYTPIIVLGWASASESLGRKLFLVAGREVSRPTHVATGWSVLLLASCVPILGWFVIAPYALTAGMGSVLLGFFSKDEV